MVSGLIVCISKPHVEADLLSTKVRVHLLTEGLKVRVLPAERMAEE